MSNLSVRVTILNLELVHRTNNGHHGLDSVAVDNWSKLNTIIFCISLLVDYPTNTGLDKQKKAQRKVVNIFLQSVLTYVLGAQKNRLIETVLLSTHNICFGWEIRKSNFRYAL